jgi:hypothetical protein
MLVNVVTIMLIAGSLFCIVLDEEYWPFSQYPMFSWVTREYSISEWRLYGVTQEEPHGEIPLLTSTKYIKPFDQIRLQIALGKIVSTPDAERRQNMLDKALLDLLERYEQLRRARHHGGPPLQGIRLYSTWSQFDPRRVNVDFPKHRKLVAEVKQQSDV